MDLEDTVSDGIGARGCCVVSGPGDGIPLKRKAFLPKGLRRNGRAGIEAAAERLCGIPKRQNRFFDIASNVSLHNELCSLRAE